MSSYEKKREKESFLYSRMPTNKCGRMRELENYHLAAIRVNNSTKKHHWMQFAEKQNIYSLKVSAHKMLANLKEKN